MFSSQVGCALACTFCSTAQQGFNRNLTVSEIIGQVWRASKIIGNFGVTGVRSYYQCGDDGHGGTIVKCS